MTSTSEYEHQTDRVTHALDRPASRAMRWIAPLAPLLALAALAAGCGGSHNPGAEGAGSPPTNDAPATGSTSGVYAEFLAYARCMRSNGIPDFPDPNTGRGGVGFQISGGPGSDLNKHNPTFQAAEQACRSLLPGGGQSPPPLSATKIAAEVKWAQCMRAHGLTGFPDPNSRGAFDSSKFEESSPAFQTASKACKSEQPSGPTPAVPGSG